MNEFAEYIGKTFNRLTIKEILNQSDAKGRTLCRCSCSCGKSCIRPLHNVIEGSVKSCGCLRIERSIAKRKKCMIGKKFGRLRILKEDGRDKNGNIYYVCKCDCGNTIKALGSNIRRGLTTSCGCYHAERRHDKAKDIRNKRFGHLTAIEPTSKRSGSFVVWKCFCDYCGKYAFIPLNHLINGQQSCGKCSYQSDLARERMTVWKTKEEKMLSSRLSSMMTRCYDKKSQDYPDYGGRGIYVCKEWTDDRHNFVKWGLASGFKPGLSIDRIDNDGPYAPWNCRWVDNYTQANNKRSNRYFTIMGHRGTISDWAFLISRKPSVLYHLSRVDQEGVDLKEYIQYRWGKLSDVERAIMIGALNEKKGLTSCLVQTV